MLTRLSVEAKTERQSDSPNFLNFQGGLNVILQISSHVSCVRKQIKPSEATIKRSLSLFPFSLQSGRLGIAEFAEEKGKHTHARTHTN